MATGDVMLTLTPLQYAEYTALRARLAEAERERDYWRKEFRDVVDAGVEAIRAVQEERDRYRAALDWLESVTLADTWGLAAVKFDNQRKRWEQVTLISNDNETCVFAATLLDAVALARAAESEATNADK